MTNKKQPPVVDEADTAELDINAAIDQSRRAEGKPPLNGPRPGGTTVRVLRLNQAPTPEDAVLLFVAKTGPIPSEASLHLTLDVRVVDGDRVADAYSLERLNFGHLLSGKIDPPRIIPHEDLDLGFVAYPDGAVFAFSLHPDAPRGYIAPMVAAGELSGPGTQPPPDVTPEPGDEDIELAGAVEVSIEHGKVVVNNKTDMPIKLEGTVEDGKIVIRQVTVSLGEITQQREAAVTADGTIVADYPADHQTERLPPRPLSSSFSRNLLVSSIHSLRERILQWMHRNVEVQPLDEERFANEAQIAIDALRVECVDDDVVTVGLSTRCMVGGPDDGQLTGKRSTDLSRAELFWVLVTLRSVLFDIVRTAKHDRASPQPYSIERYLERTDIVLDIDAEPHDR